MTGRHMAVRLVAIPLLALAVFLPGLGQAAMINDQAGGLVEVTNESGLLVSGLEGTLVLRLGKPGEMRYESRDLRSRREEIPVALWVEGSTLILSPLVEDAPQRVFLEVTVPPGLDVGVEAQGSVVHASGLMSEFEVRGSELELRLSGVGDDVEIEVDGGSVDAGAIEGAVSVQGEGLAVKLQQIGGAVGLTLKGSTAELVELRGGVEADLKETTLVVQAQQGQVRVEAEGGRVELTGVRQGADLTLSGTPLAMVDVERGVELHTDSEVRFRDMKSNLIINSYGGAVRGFGNTGGVEIASDGAVVHLEAIQGPVKVEGQDLRVQLKELRDQITVRTSMSEIHILDAAKGIEVENDFGNVSISKAAGHVAVTSRDGDVHIDDLGGSLQLQANGHEVSVAWSTVGGEKDSSVINEGGDVIVGLPAGARCRIEAESGYGRVDSSLPDVRSTDDGRHASGILGGASKPVIRVRSEGQVSIAPYDPKSGG